MMSSKNLLPLPELEFGDQRAFKQVSIRIKCNANENGQLLTDNFNCIYRDHRMMDHVVESDHQNSIKNKMIPFTIEV